MTSSVVSSVAGEEQGAGLLGPPSPPSLEPVAALLPLANLALRQDLGLAPLLCPPPPLSMPIVSPPWCRLLTAASLL